MKIDEKRPDIQTYGSGTEEKFQVGNLGRILKILRNSMYAAPIKAICREIASNARDAHREVGTSEQPIEIHLPNNWDQHYKIKDYGPGISPERMSNVFIMFGNSTKNDDNIQTGGFGLGAKTPFAYSDQFQICTTSEDQDGKRVMRTYIAYIDDSEAGKMRLVSEIETENPCGTEISIYVSTEDFSKFADATVEVCRYWDPRPILNGRVTVDWPEEKRTLFLQGSDWHMFKPSLYGSYYEYNEQASIAIVDGIMYPINPSNIDGINNIKKNLLKKGLKLFFETGDIRLSANREELQYDDKTCSIILERLEVIIGEITNLINKNVCEAKTYTDAAIKYHEFRSYLNFAIDKDWSPTWKGTKIPPTLSLYYKYTGLDSCYHIDVCAMVRHRRTYNPSLKKESTKEIDISKNMVILLNDLTTDRVSRSRVQHYIENNKLECAYVITAPNGNLDEAMDKMKEDNYYNVDLRLLNIVKLSEIDVPRKKSGKKQSGRGGRSAYSAFVYNPNYTSFRSCDNNWEPIEIDLANGNGVYVVISGRSNNKTSQIIPITDEQISQAKAFINHQSAHTIPIYGIRQRDIHRIGDKWKPFKLRLEEKITEKIQNLGITEQEIINRVNDNNYIIKNKLSNNGVEDIISHTVNKHKELLSKNSSALKFVEELNKVKKEFLEVSNLWSVMGIVNKKPSYKNHNSNIEKLTNKCCMLYPLLKYCKAYPGPKSEELIKYIMMADKSEEEEIELGLDNNTETIQTSVISI
jgi:hypothetical protein